MTHSEAPPVRPSPTKGRKRCQFEGGCPRYAELGEVLCPWHALTAPEPLEVEVTGAHPVVFGTTEPRLWTPPLRPLTRHTSLGFQVIEFAKYIGEPLDAWQEWAAIHSLELDLDGFLRFGIILIIVARQNGKSALKRVITLWRMYIHGARLILGTAQDLDQARDQWKMCLETIYENPDLMAELAKEGHTNGDEYFELASRGVYKIKALNRKAGRGKTADEVNIDELREQHDWMAWSAVSKTVSARPNGQVWCMSNAGDDKSVVLNQLRASALARRDPRIFIAEWSAPEGCELDDLDAILQANPGVGFHGPSLASIRTSRNSDPPAEYRTEVLCQNVPTEDPAIDAEAWDASADAGGILGKGRTNLALGLEISENGEHASLVAASVLTDGRVRVEVAVEWRGSKKQTPTEQVRYDLQDLLIQIKPAAFGWFPAGPAAALSDDLNSKDWWRPVRLKVPNLREKRKPERVVGINGTAVPAACMSLADLVKNRMILHPNDPLLNAHVKLAQKQKVSDGWRFVRLDVGNVDAAYALAGAVQLARTLPKPGRPGLRILD